MTGPHTQNNSTFVTNLRYCTKSYLLINFLKTKGELEVLFHGSFKPKVTDQRFVGRDPLGDFPQWSVATLHEKFRYSASTISRLSRDNTSRDGVPGVPSRRTLTRRPTNTNDVVSESLLKDPPVTSFRCVPTLVQSQDEEHKLIFTVREVFHSVL